MASPPPPALSRERGPIAYYVHGHGRGHASRALSVVPALRRAGHDVRVFASGQALAELGALGVVGERPLLLPGPLALLKLAARAWAERRELLALGAALVVSDGDQGALLGARAAGLSTLALGHDLLFTRCALPPTLSSRDRMHQWLNALVPSYLSHVRVAVHFLPARALDPGTRVARPSLAGAGEPKSEQRGDHVVAYFRDALASPVVAAARAQVPALRVFGAVGGERADREPFRALLSTARAAMGSAGSNFLAECALFGTPVLACYRDDDPEQRLNAQLAEAAGFAMAVRFSRFAPPVIADFLARVAARQFSAPSGLVHLPSVDVAVLEALASLK